MSATESRKLDIFFPGIGYTKDRPLLHYSRKMAKKYGYEEICIEYHNLPFIVEKTEEEMLRAIEKAIPQVEEQLSKIDYSDVEEILLVGKSIGTALATKLCTDRHFKKSSGNSRFFKCRDESAPFVIAPKYKLQKVA